MRTTLTSFDPDEFRRLRRAAGLRQSDVAEELGVSLWTISSWETGRTTPSVERLTVAAAVLGVDVVDLLATPTTLADYRAAAGLSQQQVATALGVSRPLVGFWETGDARVPDELLNALAELYDLNPTALMGIADRQAAAGNSAT